MSRILVIDDVPPLADLVRHILQKKGHEVVVAYNGMEGLEKIENEGPFDLYISDWNMPVMSGKEFAYNVRNDKTPIIIYSATEEMEFIRQNSKGLGIASILEKPARNQHLYETIKEVLER